MVLWLSCDKAVSTVIIPRVFETPLLPLYRYFIFICNRPGDMHHTVSRLPCVCRLCVFIYFCMYVWRCRVTDTYPYAGSVDLLRVRGGACRRCRHSGPLLLLLLHATKVSRRRGLLILEVIHSLCV